MLELLEGTEQYNNAGALLGLDGLEGEELLGALRRMNPIARQRTINKLASPAANSKGSRAEMEKHFGELPDHIKAALSKGELRLADTIVYSIKPVNSKTVKLFETQDVKEVGIRNLSNAKLPKNQALLVRGIVLLASIPADASADKVMASKFLSLENFPAIANGEFSLKANKKIIVPETSVAAFKTENIHSVPLGYYKLANPRLIQDDILIEFTVELGTMEGLDAKTQLYVGLHGTITTP
jgi:hypothetical protein